MALIRYFNRKCFNPWIALKGSTHISYISTYTFIVKTYIPFFFSWRHNPLVGRGLLIHKVCFPRSHTTCHSRYESSGRVISSSQTPLPDNTQHPQQKNIHFPGGIRTHNLSRRTAADLRLRQLGRWYRHLYIATYIVK
jgi:hypothetical protein